MIPVILQIELPGHLLWQQQNRQYFHSSGLITDCHLPALK